MQRAWKQRPASCIRSQAVRSHLAPAVVHNFIDEFSDFTAEPGRQVRICQRPRKDARHPKGREHQHRDRHCEVAGYLLKLSTLLLFDVNPHSWRGSIKGVRRLQACAQHPIHPITSFNYADMNGPLK